MGDQGAHVLFDSSRGAGVEVSVNWVLNVPANSTRCVVLRRAQILECSHGRGCRPGSFRNHDSRVKIPTASQPKHMGGVAVLL